MPNFDKIIRNGTIVDGTGGMPAFRGDIGIKNGKIAMISGRIQGSATEELDATGCIVAPGAIMMMSAAKETITPADIALLLMKAMV